MKKITVLFLILGFIFCAPVSQSDAENIAANFYNYKNDPRENNFTIESTQVYSIENDNIFKYSEVFSITGSMTKASLPFPLEIMYV